MKKFEILERIQIEQQRAKSKEIGYYGEEKEPIEELPEQLLKKVFEETTMFSVEDVVEPAKEFSEKYYLNEYGVWDFEDEFINKGDSDWNMDSSSDIDLSLSKAKRRKKIGSSRKMDSSSTSYINNRYRGAFRAFRKTSAKKGIRYTRCKPHPMAASFCHYIKPYEESISTTFPEADIVHDNLASMLEGNKVFGIYLNFPWVYRDEDHHQTNRLWELFKDLKFSDSLIEAGLVFVYLPNFLFGDAVKIVARKKFKWVEKAVVVPRDFGYIRVSKSRYLSVAAMGLHIFRKMAKGRLPMQHQRVTNVCLLSGEDKMFYTYDLIEQMLPPTFRGQKNVRLLELYDVGEKREGWIQIRHKARTEGK